MKKSLSIKLMLLGFLSWLIPFVISFLFYKPGGELMVPYGTFKATIMVVGTISGCYLLFQYFKFIQTEFIRHAIIAGLVWFALNIILDAVILIPIMKTTFSDYFMTIGIGYIAIPTISIAMGFILNAKIKLS